MLVAIWNSDRTTQYEIELDERDGRLVVTCSCPAGRYGKLCRHKRMLLAGDLCALSDGDSAATIKTMLEHADRTTLHVLVGQLSDAESRITAATKEKKDATRALEQLLIQGIPLRDRH